MLVLKLKYLATRRVRCNNDQPQSAHTSDLCTKFEKKKKKKKKRNKPILSPIKPVQSFELSSGPRSYSRFPWRRCGKKRGKRSLFFFWKGKSIISKIDRPMAKDIPGLPVIPSCASSSRLIRYSSRRRLRHRHPRNLRRTRQNSCRRNVACVHGGDEYAPAP